MPRNGPRDMRSWTIKREQNLYPIRHGGRTTSGARRFIKLILKAKITPKNNRIIHHPDDKSALKQHRKVKTLTSRRKFTSGTHKPKKNYCFIVTLSRTGMKRKVQFQQKHETTKKNYDRQACGDEC